MNKSSCVDEIRDSGCEIRDIGQAVMGEKNTNVVHIQHLVSRIPHAESFRNQGPFS